MNFDFGWFLTVPGMLITGGVLLLVIALIILIVTTRNKKEDYGEVSSDVANNGAVMSQAVVGNESDLSSVQVMPNTTEQVVTADSNSIMDAQAPVSTIQPQDVQPTVDVNNMNTNMTAFEQTPLESDVTPEMAQVNPVEVADVQSASTDLGVAPQAMNNSFQSVEPSVFAPESVASVQMPAAVDTQITPDMPVVETPTVTPEVASVQMPTVTPEVSTPDVISTPSDPVVEMPTVTPEVSSIEMPTITPEVSTPDVVTPQISPVVESPVTDNTVIEPLLEQNIPTVDSQNVVEPLMEQPVVQPAAEPVIYGGANPSVSNIDVTPEPSTHQIYGGANPLENTQSIPISNIAGPNAVSQVQTPVAEPTIVASQVEPISVVQNIEQ